MIDLVTEFAPNFRQSIVGMRVLTPTDLDREFGLPRTRPERGGGQTGVCVDAVVWSPCDALLSPPVGGDIFHAS